RRRSTRRKICVRPSMSSARWRSRRWPSRALPSLCEAPSFPGRAAGRENPPLNLTEHPRFATGYVRSSARILFLFEPRMAHMELKEVQRHWDAFGKTDPLWAILTQPDKRHGKWKYDEFFACGEEEIGRILRHAEALAFPLRWGRALDFGCGAGRLTQA